MNSGFYITWYLLVSVLVIFPAWELTQLYRRRKGNKSARTMSQYVINRAENGSKLYRVIAIAFPALIIFVGLWLIFHWEGFCHTILIDDLCRLSEKV